MTSKKNKKRDLQPKKQQVQSFIGTRERIQLPQLLSKEQRKMRHIVGIYGRNINENNWKDQFTGLLNCFFRIECGCEEIGEYNVVYTSEIVFDSMNPQWRTIEPINQFPKDILDLNWFKVKVFNHSVDRYYQLFESIVHLKDCSYLGHECVFTTNPPNSLQIELVDGFYSICNFELNQASRGENGDVFSTETGGFMLMDSGSHLSLSPLRTRDTSVIQGNDTTKKDFFKILVSHRKLKSIEDETNLITTAIENGLQEREVYLKKVQRKQLLELRVSKLRKECSDIRNTVEEARTEVDSMKSEILPQVSKIAKAEVALLASMKMLEEEKSWLVKDNQMLEKIQNRLLQRRWDFVRELASIYPIHSERCPRSGSKGKKQPVDSSKAFLDGLQDDRFFIKGVWLPNSDFTGCEEEEIATALGNVCHLVQMLAKYLELPPRYPMLPMCSRSIIRDEISTTTPQKGSHFISQKYPLYSRGVDRTRFEYGVFLLNKNVEQLLNSQGIEIVSLKHTLPNLFLLLNHTPPEVNYLDNVG